MYLRLFFVILAQITSCFCKMRPLPGEGVQVRESLTQCVKFACERFFEEGTMLYVLPTKEVEPHLSSVTVLDRLLLYELMKDCQWAFSVRNVSMDTEEETKPEYYVLQLRKIEDFFDDIQVLRGYKNWNPHGRFLIFAPRIMENPIKVAKEIMKRLWGFHVVNGVILLPDVKNKTKFNAYSWFPYKDRNCGDDFATVTYIDSCSFGKNSDFVHWYPNKIPQKFHNCTVKVRTVELPPYAIGVANNTWSNTSLKDSRGTEINMLELIGKVCNLSMYYTKSVVRMNYGDVLSNGTATGNLKTLQDEEVDVAIGAYAKTIQRSLFFDDAYYHFEDLIFCVPSFLKDNNFVSTTTIMGIEAFIATFFVYITLTVLMWLTSGEDRDIYRNFSTCSLASFVALLAFPVSLPKTTRVRFFFALLLLYSFYIITAYQTLLTSALATATNRQKITKLTELVQTQMNIYGMGTGARYFSTDGTSSETNNLNAAILRKWRQCTKYDVCLKLMAVRKDRAVCFPKSVVEYFITNYKGPMIYCFKQAAVSYPLTIFMRKGFQLFERFEMLISRIISAGFLQKWNRDVLSMKYENVTTNEEEVTTKDGNLNLDSLSPIFGVWATGLAIGAAVFVAEVAYNRWINKIK